MQTASVTAAPPASVGQEWPGTATAPTGPEQRASPAAVTFLARRHPATFRRVMIVTKLAPPPVARRAR